MEIEEFNIYLSWLECSSLCYPASNAHTADQPVACTLAMKSHHRLETAKDQITMEVAGSAARNGFEEGLSGGTETPGAKQITTWKQVQELAATKRAEPPNFEKSYLDDQSSMFYNRIMWRDWQYLHEVDLPSSQHFDFTVLSYNILSQDLLEKYMYLYQHCSPDILRWEYRWPKILRELQYWDAEVLCLQEVQEDHYRQYVQPTLSAYGYNSHYKRRTGRRTDGCCTSFKAQYFTLLCERHVEYFRPGIEVLNCDNVGIVLLLQPRLADSQDGCPPTPLCVANTHLAYHPERGDAKLAQVALLLAEVDELSCSSNGSRCPIILCGDLNSTPNSPLYQLLHNGVLDCKRGLPAWKVSGQRLSGPPHSKPLSSPLWPDILGINNHCQYVTQKATRTTDRRMYTREDILQLRDYALLRPEYLAVIEGVTDKQPGGEELGPRLLLQHRLNLTSAYLHYLAAKNRPEVTILSLGVGSTVDYIFYSAEPFPARPNKGLRFFVDGQLKLLGRLCLLSEDDLLKAQGLPNPWYSSDHLHLVARFSLELSK
ncbi:protein angel homolog 1 isoform X3 [Pseudophryne corroboree]|uniref:protein angel homolog 1 isoform X3 n=1 Tax=Pseudophryne corroboree TaxID=495146 RepID=UPI0030818A91